MVHKSLLLPRFSTLPVSLFLLATGTGCIAPINQTTVIVEPASRVAAAQPAVSAPPQLHAPLPEAIADEEFSELMAIMRHDLTRSTAREAERGGLAKAVRRELEPARLSTAFSSLPMPVAGLTGRDIHDSFGFPRDGGRRRHRGIDIFAPRGTAVVAVVDGYLSYIGDQNKGGRCVWLVNEEGYSFYYAHLDRWAPGIYEGMEVSKGDLIGFVGTTGNAVGTPPHLHFQVSRQDEILNPFPLLRAYSGATLRPTPVLQGGFGGGMDK